MVPYVSAAPNQKFIPITGTAVIGEENPSSILFSGPIAHIIATQGATFSGSFKGTVEVHWSILENLKTGETKDVGLGTFTGTLDGTSGTFTFVTTGLGIGDTFYNTWIIIGGIGGFSTLHGKGILTINITAETGEYSGDIFFNS